MIAISKATWVMIVQVAWSTMHRMCPLLTVELFRGNCELGLGGYGDREGGVSRLLIIIIILIKIKIILKKTLYLYFAIISGSGRFRYMVGKISKYCTSWPSRHATSARHVQPSKPLLHVFRLMTIKCSDSTHGLHNICKFLPFVAFLSRHQADNG